MNKKRLGMLALAFTVISFPAYSWDYEECLSAAKVDDDYAVCMKSESSRLINEIKREYDAIGRDSRFKTWDKGKSQNSNNLKNLFNDWLNYRNNYCSLYMLSMSTYIGSNEYNRQKCIYDMTSQQYELIKQIRENAHLEIIGS